MLCLGSVEENGFEPRPTPCMIPLISPPFEQKLYTVSILLTSA